MGSSRLPGKALADVGGEPALTRLLRRLRRAERVDEIILATTTAPADDVLAEWGASHGVAVHRGSEEDVLRRVVEAHQSVAGEIVVEITGDCVLVDPELVDVAIQSFDENDCHVVTNTTKRSFPNGMDVQVYGLADLAEVEREVDDPAVREHVSLYFYEHPEQYRIVHLFAPSRWARPEYRLVLDYPEDLVLLNEICRRLEPRHGDRFGLEEIMALLREDPRLPAINEHCVEKSPR